jgi:lysine decarboxylase
MSPGIDSATGVPIGIALLELEKALTQNPIAVLLTEPGYLGTLSDLKPLIDAAHAKSIPVIVDAAWGGHFGFHPDLPAHVISQGADALITSVHKALPGYSASALLLAKTKYLSAERLEQSFETTHTTSPAGAPLASIDAVRALLQTRGSELLGALIEKVAQFKSAVQANFDLPIFLNPSDFPAGRFDPVKIVLRAQQLGASGVDIERALITEGIRVEMADRDTIVFLATLADTTEDFQVLAMKLVQILKKLQSAPRASATALSWSVVPQIAMSMREAYFAKTKLVSSTAAIGQISADLIAPYPPGVAVVAPGELLTEQIVSGLVTSQKAGVRIAYATDPTLKTFRIVSSG